MGTKRKASESTPAFAVIAAAGVPHTAHSYAHDPRHESYGTEAAEAMGVEPARIFKTLMADVDGILSVAVVPVTGSLDLKALAEVWKAKRAQMADVGLAQRATGYVVGGISPLGQRKPHRTAVDASALKWPTVFVSAGRRGLEVELAPADLVRLTDAVVARLSR